MFNRPCPNSFRDCCWPDQSTKNLWLVPNSLALAMTINIHLHVGYHGINLPNYQSKKKNFEPFHMACFSSIYRSTYSLKRRLASAKYFVISNFHSFYLQPEFV